MKVISSQRHLNFDIVDQKIEEIKFLDFVTLPIIDTEMTDLDGNDLYILVDGHHRKEAAAEIGIEIRYEEVKNVHGVTGEALLDTCYNDSDWYDVETGDLVW